MKKRLISILMCAAMVLTLLPTTVLAADPTDYWTDAENVGALPVPVDDVYTITSAAELAAVAKAVNEQTNDFSGKTILLADSIDLSAHLWVPIGSSYSSPFRGSLNGAGHAITGLTVRTNTDAYVGLFGYIIGGTYSDVTVTGSVSVEQNDNYSYVGGLIGCIYNSSSDSTKLSNVTTDVDISGKCYYSGYFGGMVGYCAYCEFENCTASGDVSGTLTHDDDLYLGGLTGYCRNCDFEKCAASGTISGTVPDGDDFFVGGLIGYSYNNNADAALKNSYATGSVTGVASGYSDTYVGGLVGYNDRVSVKNCYAAGAVDARSADDEVYVGGLAGYSSGAVDGCYATGTVTGRSDYPDTVYAGGLVGLNYAAVNHSYATGDVTATKGYPVYCGGFVGDNWFAIYNSYAAGSVNASSGYSEADAVGGSFAGRNNKEIINCCALGNVTVKGNDQTIGGVFLGIANVNSSIRNCYAVGSVTSSATSGTTVTNGFAGVVKTASSASESDGEISHCIYRENGITPVNGETKSDGDMKSTAFADELNEWINTYDGLETPLSFWKQSGTDYPVFDEDASPAVSYDIWLGGVRITSINCDDIAAAINKKAPDAASGSAVYTPASGDSSAVLTLSDFHFSGKGCNYYFRDSYGGLYDNYYGLYTEDDLEIVLSGDNTITETSADTLSAVASSGIGNVSRYSESITLTFSGSGSITAKGADSSTAKSIDSTYGIYIVGDIVLEDTVSITGIGGDVIYSAEAGVGHTGNTYGISAGNITAPAGTSCTGIGGSVALTDNLAADVTNAYAEGYSHGIYSMFSEAGGAVCGKGGNLSLTSSNSSEEYSRRLEGFTAGIQSNMADFTGPFTAIGGTVSLSAGATDNPYNKAISVGFWQETSWYGGTRFSGPVIMRGDTSAISASGWGAPHVGSYSAIIANYTSTQTIQVNTDNTEIEADMGYITTGPLPGGDGTNAYKYLSIAPLYTVTVENGGNGTAEADKTSAAVGETITLTATPSSGYHFKEWQSSDVTINGDTFTMPEKNVTVTAIFEADETGAYTVTFDANGGSVTPANATTGADGTLASLPTPTRNGSYSFSGWYTEVSGGTIVDTATVFTADTTIYAKWTKNSGGSSAPTTFENTVADSTHGSVSINKNNARAGEIVTINVNPDQGYTLETITVTDRNGKNIPVTAEDGKYTFTMPASKVTIEATFMEDNSMLNFFVDVPVDTYYYDAVLWAVENGITFGTDDTHFSPDLTCTRAQVVTFLWRAVGCPEVESEMTFTDVVKGSYYEKAVAWAMAEGITKGTSETEFSPDATCNRGQIGTFLWRAAGSPAMLNMTAAGPAVGSNPFWDVSSMDYFYQAVLWAVDNGITNGTTATTFSPNAECTRAQIVTFLYRNMGK